jgi:chromosome segregation ATPase
LRAELKSRDDSLNQAQAAAGKAQADLAERVESLNEEVQAVQELRGELSRLKPELAEAQARGERLAATLKRRDGSLEQAQAAAAKLQADLAAAQQLAEQCKARAAEIESINDLLLLQVHQPQEELEKFFIENQQLRQVMSQSSQSFDRARRLISRLMLTEREGGLALPLKPVAQTAAAAADVGAAKAA